MEPILTLEGFQLQQNTEQSRSALSDYYRRQGYTVVEPHTAEQDKEQKPWNGSAKAAKEK